MNYLILGGNGYLGSKLTRLLISSGHTVVCTKRVNSDLSRVHDLYNKIKWIPASIDAVEAVSNYIKFDTVINMACNYGRENVLYGNVLEANIEFPLKVLNKTVEKGTRRFLTLGTGLPDDLNMYSFSKKMLNDFGKFYVEKHGIDYFCLQLEMIYGADEPKDRFLPSVISRMIRGEEVRTTVGTQKRDIIYAEDIITAIVMILNSSLHGYNEIPVGTGEAPAVFEIVDYIWEQTGKKSLVKKGSIPMRENEPDCIADLTIMKSIGPWNPKPWRKGIYEMIKQMEEQYENID